VPLDCGFRLDVLVEERLPLELKAVAVVLPIHDAQLLTYMRLGGYPLGLLMNFEVAVLKDGIHRKALTKPPGNSPESPVDLRGGFDALSGEILHAALEVHRTLGPGLLRSAYEECLCYELGQRRIPFERQYPIPLRFEGCDLAQAVEVPLVVAGQVPVFCLSVSSLNRLHEACLQSRLRQGNWPYGFLFNFNVPTLNQGIRRRTR
jgi:GxxExxY protein